MGPAVLLLNIKLHALPPCIAHALLPLLLKHAYHQTVRIHCNDVMQAKMDANPPAQQSDRKHPCKDSRILDSHCFAAFEDLLRGVDPSLDATSYGRTFTTPDQPCSSPSEQADSDSPTIVLDDCHTVETPPQNRRHQRTFSPLSATLNHACGKRGASSACDEGKLTSIMKGSDNTAHAEYAHQGPCGGDARDQEVQSVLSRLPECGQISREYMRVQHALGKAVSPQLSPCHPQPCASQSPSLQHPSNLGPSLPPCSQISDSYLRVQQALGKAPTSLPQQPHGPSSLPSQSSNALLQQQPHRQQLCPPTLPPQPGALRKKPTCSRASRLDHRDPFAWDPTDRRRALQEAESSEPSSRHASNDQAAVVRPRTCAGLMQTLSDQEHEGLCCHEGLTCWDSVSSLDDVVAASAKVQKPVVRAPIKSIPPAHRLHMQRIRHTGSTLATARSC